MAECTTDVGLKARRVLGGKPVYEQRSSAKVSGKPWKPNENGAKF